MNIPSPRPIHPPEVTIEARGVGGSLTFKPLRYATTSNIFCDLQRGEVMEFKSDSKYYLTVISHLGLQTTLEFNPYQYEASCGSPAELTGYIGKEAFDRQLVFKYPWVATYVDPDRFIHKKVIFNPPATIIIWSDNTKTIVKCGPNDTYDPEKGLALCFMKRALGNNNKFHKVLNKEVLEYYMQRKEEPMPEEET